MDKAITNLKNNTYLLPFIGIDIGGTLAKICFSVSKQNDDLNIEHIKELKSLYILK